APIEPPAAAAVAVAAPPEPVLSRLDQALPGLGLRLEVLDCGRLLIDFHQGAQELAEAGARLKANRQKHAELLEELRRLDAEYEQIAQAISRDQEFYQLLARLLQIREGGVSP
ncbi:MAG: hypothetical protein IRY99_23380, partial [Isosphaeraceae bacterium]|nr:hypothetical protein [Isosphaeraceae bacterium]